MKVVLMMIKPLKKVMDSLKKLNQSKIYLRTKTLVGHIDNDTRIHKKAIKHSKYRLNIIATVYLDYQNPIPYFEINEETTTGSIYAKYISDRVLPEHINFDIIDRHSTHRAYKSNIKRGDAPVKEIYLQEKIKEDFTPAGTPQYCPTECLFSYISKYLEDESPKYNAGLGWIKDDMLKVIKEAISKVTFKMVQGWYERTYKELFPRRKIPKYLRSDIDKSTFENEIQRTLKFYNLQQNTKNVSSYGRIIKKIEH